ncbi:MAG TPA: cytochrome b/b6 domain-containing protein, partial [Caulobacteraceae bacterium]|nr:cytochrome b/b6 domain-containing protein [Caulobacteraceae bacterium]
MAPPADRYPAALQALHWALAALVGGQFVLMLVLHQLLSLDFAQVALAAHRQCGALVLVLVALRLALAVRRRAPAPLAESPAWQTLAARAAHL